MATDNLLGLDTLQVWDTDQAFHHLNARGLAATKRTAERRLHELGILPPILTADALRCESGEPPLPQVLAQELERARAKRKLVLFAQLASLPTQHICLYANDARGAHYWVPLSGSANPEQAEVEDCLHRLGQHVGKPVAVFPHGALVPYCRAFKLKPADHLEVSVLSYPVPLILSGQRGEDDLPSAHRQSMPHLDQLEAESIHIIREAFAESEHPAMLYSVGKDSTVMLHLARKAFYPAPPPFPLLHVDTRWKFREMYQFRDHMASESGIELLVYTNPEAIAKNINPFDHGSALHTDITKTEGLKQALDKYQFDMVFGGARRDEEKSRAKERIFSFRTQTHQWDPKNQRPELWNLYNARKRKGESIRVFPLSNWTELDIWQYIYRENIPVVPLYFARERPVVMRNGMLLMVDDARMRLLPGEVVEKRKVRFRTLGCYPLTGAIESDATSLSEIILELIGARSSERQGRAIDADASASMEKKKQEGYF
ncbi:Sulfate adenylyltransferase subunit 2 [Achromobacter pulmonis]|uniref:Sulfate adenylyltransferase subunit 2 n=2 Tax=Achromobacter pulmonis TaxID=1389932 RepID=A0A6S7DZ55_9BURK|nr:Sulfate adenylyltransferase subunit 2 [Achromobacter pulmonis]CAB3872651.1 Sulfate adenylyltransferase subunit 2 [Achromobacter pulmonis]